MKGKIRAVRGAMMVREKQFQGTTGLLWGEREEEQ